MQTIQIIQNIHFSVEMWGALFSLVGILIVFLTRYFDKVGSRKLMLVLLCAALLMISDGLAWLYRGNTTDAGYYVVRIANFCSFFFGFLIMPLAAQYISHLIYVRSNGVRLYWEIFEWGIFIFGAALLILNEFVPYIYTFDRTNTYQRLPYFFWVPGFIAFVGAIITLSVAIAYHKYMMALENALHHGINDGQLENGMIVISTDKINNKHIVTIEDNGNGFDTAILDEENSHHVGIKNTRERITAMCDGTLNIESAPGKGTKVTMVIPD